MKGTWHIGRKGNAFAYKIGSVIVANVYWDSSSPKDAPNKYAAAVMLPGIGNAMASHYETAEDAKAYVEKAVTSWFDWCGITEARQT